MSRCQASNPLNMAFNSNQQIRGCVTPAQIQNVKISIENDVNNLDGYDDLSPEMQEKVKNAIELGHVADEDWRGVSPGFNIFASLCAEQEYRTLSLIAQGRKGLENVP